MASESFNRLNPGLRTVRARLQIVGKRIRSAQPKRHQVLPLDGAGQGEGEGGSAPVPGLGGKVEILFTIRSVRPQDWDNVHTKCLQDLLIKAGILSGDKWDQLQGRIVSEKVHSEEEEGVEIEIKEIC